MAEDKHVLIPVSALPGTLHIVYVCEMLLIINKVVGCCTILLLPLEAIKCNICTASASKYVSSMLEWKNFKSPFVDMLGHSPPFICCCMKSIVL